ncbi:hypothetical protein L228DRAFT_90954 [Xylona heveae TC161]|uniref:C2H2-type domain-containing protein n=1 Tax=Xylona heveae (strain CBS 132557 / TC161) TaxID=1328760 RepID=A0A165I029_XYLHT|nr:hypothetical protein L228DRAFT_90954 [Xylona heveae TC161]KZF24163.1 hypothetical protein L228DRAFT_90954 [Xylona heveae TC161]
MSTTASHGYSARQPYTRNHSHSISLGSYNPTHRVTRRKSMTTNPAGNPAALAAAVKEADDGLSTVASVNRRSISSKDTTNPKNLEPTIKDEKSDASKYPSPPGSLPSHENGFGKYHLDRNSAGSKDARSAATPRPDSKAAAARIRRASEGSHLVKGDKKPDLRCEKCGKSYKHGSCLTKHLWEHTPEWSYTSKLLISKHQQVQLLEAASVLVAMNQDDETPDQSNANIDSDHSSASPPASGSSAHHDGNSSADTTPPPHGPESVPVSFPVKTGRVGRPKRLSVTHSGLSRSFQNMPLSHLHAGSAPSRSHAFSHRRQNSSDQRLQASGSAIVGSYIPDEDEAGLSAALELLSSSFGTPRTRPSTLPADVPPVPPLPARYLDHNGQPSSVSNVHGSDQVGSNARSQTPGNNDVEMVESEEFEDDEYERSVSRGRSDEDDDGVFGGMEE